MVQGHKWGCQGENRRVVLKINPHIHLLKSFTHYCIKQINTARLRDQLRPITYTIKEQQIHLNLNYPKHHLFIFHSSLFWNPSHLESLLFPLWLRLLSLQTLATQNANISVCVHVQLPFSLISIPWNYPSTTKIYQHVFPESCQTSELNPFNAEWRRSCGSFSSQRKGLHLKRPSRLMKGLLIRAQQCCKLVIGRDRPIYRFTDILPDI